MRHQLGYLGARRVLTFALALMMGFALMAAAVGSEAAASKKNRAKPVRVAITHVVTANQQQLLRQRKVRIRVRSTGRTKVRLFVQAGGRRGFVRPRTIGFNRRGGTRVVDLGLTPNGYRVLSRCGGKRINAVGNYHRRVGKRVRATLTNRPKHLARWAANPNCATPPDYVTVPLPEDPEHCDFLDNTVCLQPFPNDYYTKADASTPTGKRLNLGPESTPVNTGNADPTHVSVTDINRADGFSPGNLIVLKIPGLDTPAAFANTGFVGIENLSEYNDPNQPVLLIDAETGERQLIWAELDSNPTTVDPTPGDPGGINANPGNTDPVNLIIRPGKNLEHGKRYIVAFRNLKDADNQDIEAPLGFRVYRDDLPTQQGVVEQRRPHMESIISDLVDKAGVERSSLYMAWDFTVASQQSVTGRALTIRDDAFARLGDTNLANRKIEGESPEIEVLAYCDVAPLPDNSCGNNYPGIGDYDPDQPVSSPNPSASNEQRTVVGYIKDVPCYLNSENCAPGGTFEFDAGGQLTWDVNSTMDVPFRCIIPRATVSGGTVVPGGSGVYGHGLLGTLNQINATRAVANGTNSTFCAANWDGFSTLDIGTIIASLQDMSNFNKAVDRMQQGFVNFLMLQRAMVHEDGFAAEEAFQPSHDGNTPVSNPGTPSIDVSAGEDTRGFYMGISQGGIMGGALTALAPDADRGALGVTGMNYSTLLRRSVDSDQYFKMPIVGLYANYPDEATRPLLLSLMQLLWDRGEANGYAHFMTDNPLPNTNPHQVYMDMALGDHQVSNFTADVEARTNGALRYAPTLVESRHNWDITYEALPSVSTFPTEPGESVMVYYDSGPPTFTGTRGIGAGNNPLENVPPRPEWGFGRDPHSDPRASTDGIQHAIEFFETGTISQCPGLDGLCFANGWDGTSGL